jgi:uncharacterized OB-fold protein
VAAVRCERGHVHAQAGERCPECGGRTRATRLAGRATLVLVTTVRINPSGAPFRLGVAVTRSGRARVLCRVAGAVRGTGRDPVVLEETEGVMVARPARGRR